MSFKISYKPTILLLITPPSLPPSLLDIYMSIKNPTILSSYVVFYVTLSICWNDRRPWRCIVMFEQNYICLYFSRQNITAVGWVWCMHTQRWISYALRATADSWQANFYTILPPSRTFHFLPPRSISFSKNDFFSLNFKVKLINFRIKIYLIF